MTNLNELTEVKMKNGRYSLIRVSDGCGDSGPKLVSLMAPEGGATYHHELIPAGPNGLIKKGCWIDCGSITARSFAHQDSWTCTPIVEFLEIKKDKKGDTIYIRFKTLNSEYEVKSF
jgi:hypothetical protein